MSYQTILPVQYLCLYLYLLVVLLQVSDQRIGAWITHGTGTETGTFSIRQQSSRLWSFHDPSIGVSVAQRVQPSVVLVTPKGVRNMTARGSGFVIESSDNSISIVTAAHVTPPGYSIQVTWRNSSLPASVVMRNTTLDLALLQLKTTDSNPLATPLSLRECLPPVGTLVFAHGYPASRLRGPAMTSGIVCGIADGLGLPDDESFSDDYTAFVVTNAAMSGGMSGGPLVDIEGRVVGVNALIRPDLRALGNYAVSSMELVHFLKAARGQPEAMSAPSAVLLWLYNDPMNKRERVAAVLQTVAGLNSTLAEHVMMQAHTTGRGNIGNFTNLEEAIRMGQALRDQDLLVEWETQG